MLRTLAAEAARRFGRRVSFAAVADPVESAQTSPHGESFPQGSAVAWQISFADLDRLSDEAAAGLAFRGVLPGDVVALALPTVPEFPICYLAAIKIGAIVAGLNPRWPPDVLAQLTDLLRPAVTVAPFGLDAEPGPDGELVRIAPAKDGRNVLAGLRRDEVPPPPLPPDPVRPMVIAFTSGASGSGGSGHPRGAVFGVGQLDAIRAAEAGDRWGSRLGNTVLTAVPFAHYTFMTRLPAILQLGQAHYLMRSWRASVIPQLAAAVGANQVTAFPGQLAEVVGNTAGAADASVGAGTANSSVAAGVPDDGAHGDPGSGDAGSALRSIEIVVSGDAAPPPGLVQALHARFGCGIQVRYGCAEAGLGLSICADDPSAEADGCVGSPAPGVTLVLRDGSGHDVRPGDTGEVLLRSAACMSGYWNEPQASVAAFTRDRFVRTGDRGRLDENGRLVLAGRIAPG
jgi:acyl-CoA synthetase (AMP-forming)/AMP-acid ligase II